MTRGLFWMFASLWLVMYVFDLNIPVIGDLVRLSNP